MLQTDDGGFLLAGRTESSAEGINDFMLVKIDASGNIMWHRNYGNGRDEWCYSLIKTSDLGYALAGTTTNAEDRTIDVMLLKLDSNCDSVWTVLMAAG
ncbi:MAG: hypothetical protein IPP40_15475 [bacterium]|nr:hypothetical protein [bacterium]